MNDHSRNVSSVYEAIINAVETLGRRAQEFSVSRAAASQKIVLCDPRGILSMSGRTLRSKRGVASKQPGHKRTFNRVRLARLRPASSSEMILGPISSDCLQAEGSEIKL